MEITLTKKEFLEKLKTDSAFNSRYGRKHITEGKMVLPPCHTDFQFYTRELSEDERYDLCAAQKSKMTAISEEDYIKYNIPTKLITITYNNKTIKSYE